MRLTWIRIFGMCYADKSQCWVKIIYIENSVFCVCNCVYYQYRVFSRGLKERNPMNFPCQRRTKRQIQWCQYLDWRTNRTEIPSKWRIWRWSFREKKLVTKCFFFFLVNKTGFASKTNIYIEKVVSMLAQCRHSGKHSVSRFKGVLKCQIVM